MPLGNITATATATSTYRTLLHLVSDIFKVSSASGPKLWYDSLKFQDPTQVYPDGFVKGVCNRFVKTFCQYGDSCKHAHPRNLTNANLQGGLIDNMKPAALTMATNLVGGGSTPGNVVQDSMGMTWGNLPPSLKPPPEGGYPALPSVGWG